MFHLLWADHDRKGPQLKVVTPVESDCTCTFTLKLPDTKECTIYKLKIVGQSIKYEKICTTLDFDSALGICADIYYELHHFLPESRKPITQINADYSAINPQDFAGIYYRGKLYTYSMSRDALWD